MFLYIPGGWEWDFFHQQYHPTNQPPESHLLRHIRETRRNMKAINTKAKPAKPGFLIMAPRGRSRFFRHFLGLSHN